MSRLSKQDYTISFFLMIMTTNLGVANESQKEKSDALNLSYNTEEKMSKTNNHLDEYALKIRQQLKLLKNTSSNNAIPHKQETQSQSKNSSADPYAASEEVVSSESFKEKLKRIELDRTPESSFFVTALDPSDNEGEGTSRSSDLINIQKRSMDVVSGAMQFRFRNGEEGLDRLFETTTPLDLKFNTEFGQLGLNLTSVFLSSGDLPDNEFINRNYGSLAIQEPELREENISDSQSGLAVDIYYKVKGFELRVGTTPVGFEVMNQTGRISYGHLFKNGFNFNLAIAREPVKDSILSYAGLVDPLTGLTWGGVVKNSAILGFGYDVGPFGVYFSSTKALYEGENVESNEFSQVDTGLYFYPYTTNNLNVTTGFNITYMGFEENYRYFTIGHGGYFSPKYFYSVSLPVKISYEKENLKVIANMAYGVQNFEEDSALYYPSDNDIELQNALLSIDDDQPSEYNKSSKSQFASRGGLEVVYDVSYFMTAKGGIDFNRAASYNESLFSLGVEYRY